MTGQAKRVVGAMAVSAALLIMPGCSVGGGSEGPRTVTQTVEAPPSPGPEPGPVPVEGDPQAGPRLEGTWDVSRTVRRVDNYADIETGDTDSGRWRFEPLCREGACDVRLTFERGSRGAARELVLQQRGRFLSGNIRTKSTGVCNDGTRVFKGYDSRARVTLEVTSTDPSGRAAAFRGRYQANGKPDYDRTSDGACSLSPTSIEQSLEGAVR